MYVYAEVLFSWQLYHKRLELLKAVHGQEMSCDIGQHEIGECLVLSSRMVTDAGGTQVLFTDVRFSAVRAIFRTVLVCALHAAIGR